MVFYRSTVRICSVVASILQKLIQQVAVATMDFNSVESRRIGSFGPLAKLLHNFGNLSCFQSPIVGDRNPAILGEGNAIKGMAEAPTGIAPSVIST
jgi:hypothetical protein